MRLSLRRARAVPPPVVLGTYTDRLAWQRRRWPWLLALTLISGFYGLVFGLTTTYFLLQLTVPLIIVAAAVIWLLPESERAPTGLLGKLLFIFLVALLVWPDYLALALPGLPWITAVRLIGVPLAFVLFVCLSTSAEVRRDLTEVLQATPWIWRLITAFGVLAVLSVGYSTDPGISVNKLVVAGVNWFLLFFVSAYVFRTPGRAMRLAYLLWAIGVVVSLIGVQEWRHSVVPWAGHIPSFLVVQDESVQRILSGASRAATGIYRVQSKFTTSLGLAEFYALVLPFVIHFAITADRLVVRIAAALTVPFFLRLIVLTDSRLGMVGFFFSILIYLLIWGVWRWTRDRDSAFGPAVVLAYPAIFSGFIAATFFVGRLRAMVWGTGAQQASTDSRKLQVAMGLPKVVKRVWGHGIGRGAEALGFRNGADVLTIDTYYLLVALEFGVLGFLIYYALFLNAVWAGARRLRRAATPEQTLIGPILIALVNFLVIKSIFSQQENHPLVFVLLGVLAALIWRIDQAGAPILAAAAPTTSAKRPAARRSARAWRGGVPATS